MSQRADVRVVGYELGAEETVSGKKVRYWEPTSKFKARVEVSGQGIA